VVALVGLANATVATATPSTILATSSGTATPLIIDTDIFSGPDDVGGLATAFALQLKGEANVIATVVNTRTSRPVVATNSWKCTAAIAQFYGSTNTLLGTDTAGNGTETNAPNDYIGACAGYASPGTSVAPNSAVSVYRQALASQPDGSVVIASIGYFENLQALLQSGPDQFSSLSGSALVAKKVKMLVAMAGCYPSVPACAAENNVVGNPAAAQYVAANWPTKLVWSGYEVGSQFLTGGSLSDSHPSSSPVRAAYEAYFQGVQNHQYYSWDLTAVYHAIRPADPLLTEVGPGTNVVNASTGVNTFTTSPTGNQYYLNLAPTNVSGLQSSLNSLIDMHP